MFANVIQAQSGAVHGAALSALSGGGCQNLTGFTPPRYPGAPGKIPCTELIQGTTTFQAVSDGKSYAPGAINEASRTSSSYVDILGNTMIQNDLVGTISYGLGNDNYAEFLQDGAARVRYYSIEVPGLVNAVNINPDNAKALALQRIVDGMGIGYQIEGGRQLLEVPLGETRSFEIFPIDPDNLGGPVSLKQPPFIVTMMNPDRIYTPHNSNPLGVATRSVYDNGAWHYYLDVNGAVLGKVGKWIVYLQIEEREPRVVQYQSSVEGLITSKTTRFLRTTLTIAHGVNQCAAQAGVALPSMEPLVAQHEILTKSVLKEYKRVIRLLNKQKALPRGGSLRLIGVNLRRAINTSTLKMAEARALDRAALTQNLGAMTETAQTETRLALSNAALKFTEAAVNVRALYSSRTLSRVLGSLQRLAPSIPGKLIKVVKGKPTTSAALKKLMQSEDARQTEYQNGLSEVVIKLEDYRQNATRCGQ